MGDDERGELRERLRRAGVAGAEELGHFVNNTTYFEPSRFDERGAFEVLLDVLPSLNDRRLVADVAMHLRRPWARGKAFPVLLPVYKRWAESDPDSKAAWHLGDALGSTATADDLPQMIALARASRLGHSRQEIVYALGRFRKSVEAEAAARDLAEDEDVVLHAISAYRTIAGRAAALERAEEVARRHPGTRMAQQAEREARKIAKAMAR